MQFDLFRFKPKKNGAANDHLLIDGRAVSLTFKKNARAKQYILRLDKNGGACVTVPRYGTLKEAGVFAERQKEWVQSQLVKHRNRPAPKAWKHGTEFLFRGKRVVLDVDVEQRCLRFGDQEIAYLSEEEPVQVVIHSVLRKLAVKELPARTKELAEEHGFQFSKVSVRNQKTRWGSCSSGKAISLNWRLIQCPDSVRDYIILHELSHLVHLNHSVRYWKKVEQVCPGFREAERWLKAHGSLLEELR